MANFWEQMKPLLKKSNKSLLNQEITIGKISKITGVSIRSIRHYCDLELIRPVRIDHTSGYRYFAPSQISEILLIKDMRELGFSLKQIESIISKEELSYNIQRIKEHISGLDIEIKALQQKRKKLTQLVETFTWVEQGIAKNESIFTLKEYNKRFFFTCETQDEHVNGLAYMAAYKKLEKDIDQYGLKNKEVYVAFFQELTKNHMEHKGMTYGIEVEGSNDIDSQKRYEGPNSYRKNVIELEEGAYATMSYRGSYDNLYHKIYPEFIEWINKEGFKIELPVIEIYHITRPFDAITQEPFSEVQIKINKST